MNKEKEKQVLEYLDYVNKEKPSILVGINEYKDYVRIGRNKKERLQLLIMCCEELHKWTLELINEIKESEK